MQVGDSKFSTSRPKTYFVAQITYIVPLHHVCHVASCFRGMGGVLTTCVNHEGKSTATDISKPMGGPAEHKKEDKCSEGGGRAVPQGQSPGQESLQGLGGYNEASLQAQLLEVRAIANQLATSLAHVASFSRHEQEDETAGSARVTPLCAQPTLPGHLPSPRKQEPKSLSRRRSSKERDALWTQVEELRSRLRSMEEQMAGMMKMKEDWEAHRAAEEFSKQIKKLEEVGIPMHLSGANTGNLARVSASNNSVASSCAMSFAEELPSLEGLPFGRYPKPQPHPLPGPVGSGGTPMRKRPEFRILRASNNTRACDAEHAGGASPAAPSATKAPVKHRRNLSSGGIPSSSTKKVLPRTPPVTSLPVPPSGPPRSKVSRHQSLPPPNEDTRMSHEMQIVQPPLQQLQPVRPEVRQQQQQQQEEGSGPLPPPTAPPTTAPRHRSLHFVSEMRDGMLDGGGGQEGSKGDEGDSVSMSSSGVGTFHLQQRHQMQQQQQQQQQQELTDQNHQHQGTSKRYGGEVEQEEEEATGSVTEENSGHLSLVVGNWQSQKGSHGVPWARRSGIGAGLHAADSRSNPTAL